MHFAGVLYSSTTFLIFTVHAHPLEHAVTIGRTRRTVADGTVVDCRTALICTVFLRFISMAVVQVPHFMWFQPYVQAGRGSMLENVFPSTARLRRGVSRSGSVVPRTQSPFVFAWVFFYSWYYFEMGKIYLPPGLEGTNLVVYQPIGTRGQMYAQVGRCACLFAPSFLLYTIYFWKVLACGISL